MVESWLVRLRFEALFTAIEISHPKRSINPAAVALCLFNILCAAARSPNNKTIAMRFRTGGGKTDNVIVCPHRSFLYALPRRPVFAIHIYLFICACKYLEGARPFDIFLLTSTTIER